jgi:hypothetical protein
MLPRRSYRLQASLAKKSLTIEQQLPSEPSTTRTKRKATAINPERKRKARKVSKNTETAVGKTSKTFTKSNPADINNKLLSLPTEIFDLVLKNVRSVHQASILVLTYSDYRQDNFEQIEQNMQDLSVALIPTSLQSRIRRGVFPFSHRKVYSQH